MAFTHVHYVGGVYITHSHPFSDSHTHTPSQLLVIGQVQDDFSADLPDYDLQPVVHSICCQREEVAVSSTPKGVAVCHFLLRAPPVAVL